MDPRLSQKGPYPPTRSRTRGKSTEVQAGGQRTTFTWNGAGVPNQAEEEWNAPSSLIYTPARVPLVYKTNDIFIGRRLNPYQQ